MQGFVSNKQAFATNDKKVVILDKNGRPFYLFEGIKKENLFNLPKGEFFTENEIRPLEYFVKYKLPTLAKPNRFIQPKDNINITYGVNPNKCSVDLNRGEILSDFSIKDLPEYAKRFIYYHEFAHHFYGGFDHEKETRKYINAEINCDSFATYYMLKKGYNPSQCHLTVKYLLNNWPDRVKANLLLTKKR